MKKLFTLVLAAMALNASAQEIKLNTTLGNIPEGIILNEVSKMQYSTNDSSVLSITTRSGADWTINVNKIKDQAFSTRDFDAKNNPCITKYLKEFDSLDELENGDIVGIVSEDDLTTDSFINRAYGDFYGLEQIMVPYLKVKAYDFKTDNGVIWPFVTDSLYIHDVVLAYVTTDIDGQKTLMTERLCYPWNATVDIPANNVFLESHYTCVDDEDAPSSELYATMLCAKVFDNCFFVGPDYRGFGTSKDKSQLYIDIDNNPRNGVDGLIAAMNYVELAKNDETGEHPDVNLAKNATLINAGISQGASTAMGVTYYLENKLNEDEAEKVPSLSETRICAGALDLKTSIDACFASDTLYYAPLLPLIISAATVSRPDIMKDSDTGEEFTVHNYFIPEFQTRTWETYNLADPAYWYHLPGKNTLWQMMYSKMVETTALTKILATEPYGEQDGTMFGRVFVHRVLADGILVSNGEGGYKLNPDNKYAMALAAFAEHNNLCDNSLWVPKSNIYIAHDKADELVPYANTEEFVNNMSDLMKANHATLTTDILENCGLAHFVYCMAWIFSEITDLDFSTSASLIKTLMELSSSDDDEEEE